MTKEERRPREYIRVVVHGDVEEHDQACFDDLIRGKFKSLLANDKIMEKLWPLTEDLKILARFILIFKISELSLP